MSVLIFQNPALGADLHNNHAKPPWPPTIAITNNSKNPYSWISVLKLGQDPAKNPTKNYTVPKTMLKQAKIDIFLDRPQNVTLNG